MKIQYSYLKNFLNTNFSQKKLIEVFTKVGFECEIDGNLIEFDITPNRGDVLSLRGLEREFYAYLLTEPKPKLKISQLSSVKNKKVINKIDDSGCGNYHLMIIKGLHEIKNLDIKKQNFIELSGIPLIHPLVDLGNYVMLEIGAPLHVFDLDALTLPINVKFPESKNDSLKVIGGDVKYVQPTSLTIQDQSGIQAIAGIIGSECSAVSSNTVNIALEAAFFRPEIIVNQARKYGLATDASHRFERGVDPTIQQHALERYLFLLNQIAEYDSVELYHSGSKSNKKHNVKFDIKKFNNFSGLNMNTSKAILVLKNLGFNLIKKNSNSLTISIPSHRFDISIEEDLYEELLRCYGYDNIPITQPKSGPIIKTNKDNILHDLRLGFVHSGFKELMHMPFVSKQSFQNFNTNIADAAELKNPINDEEPYLRGSLFSSLFKAININLKRGYSHIKIFEIANVFNKSKSGFNQQLHLSGIIYNNQLPRSWSSTQFNYDFFSLKSELLKLLKTIGLQNIKLKKTSASSPFNENILDIYFGSKKIGTMGEINPSNTEKMLKKPGFGFEIYPEQISNREHIINIKSTSKFPQSLRDLNIVVSKSYDFDMILRVIRQAKIKDLKTSHLENIYTGAEVPSDHVSYTIRLTFQSKTKSLSESDIKDSLNTLIILLSKKIGAQVRT